jgi:hypothetical protein
MPLRASSRAKRLISGYSGAKRFPLFRRQGGVARGNGKIRGALKHREVAGLFGNHRHRLDPR